MAVLTTQFRQHFASQGYECFDDAHVQQALNYACSLCPPSCWGGRHIDGVCFLAAHLMSSQVDEVAKLVSAAAQNAEGKQFTPRSTYASTNDESLRTTFPGNEYLRLRRLVVGLTATVVGI